MKASLINMEHGECIHFSGNSATIVVDCGTRGPNKQQSVANAKTIQTFFQQTDTQAAIISHFHEDHFNCFSEAFLSKSFNRLYFPDIGFGKGHKWAHPARIKLAVLKAMVEDIRSSTTKTTSFIRFLEWVVGHGRHTSVYAVARCDSFDIGEIHIDAYWPDVQRCDSSEDVYNSLCSYL